MSTTITLHRIQSLGCHFLIQLCCENNVGIRHEKVVYRLIAYVGQIQSIIRIIENQEIPVAIIEAFTSFGHLAISCPMLWLICHYIGMVAFITLSLTLIHSQFIQI